MNKADLVEVVARSAGITKSASEKAVDGAIDAIKGALRRGQSVTLVGSLVITAPTIVFGVLGVLDDPSWHLAALVSGTVLGILVLVLGILVGGRVVDRRGPEILAAALRA